MTQPEPGPDEQPGQQPPPYSGAYGQPHGQQPGQVPQGPSPYSPDEHGRPYVGTPGYGAGPYGELASRWARLGALLLDSVLIGTVSLVLSLPFIDWDAVIDPYADTGSYFTTDLTTSAISTVLGFFYFWLMHARSGQTLGKKAAGIRVIREQDGGAISSGTAAWRYGVQILLAIPCGLGSVLDALWILWDPRKQTLHDKAAHTLVVKVVPGMPDPYAKH
ncbi:RDD family protein [Actinomadura sp. 9N407]|uniref:RDD family protein n=1 Tax=Actinomadura sp. 9N407 TaxID=3375154 RepID=UPI0037BA6871